MKTKKRRIARTAAAAVLLFFCTSGAIFAAYIISGPSGGRISLIPVSNVNCRGEMTASPQMINTGQSVTFQLKDGGSPGNFTGHAMTHNGTTEYRFAGVSRFLIVVEGREYFSDRAVHRFSKAGTYEAKGYITFRWTTSKNKIRAGYPPSYFRTLILSRTIRVTDLEEAAEGENTKEQTEPAEEEKEKEADAEPQTPIIVGTVSHTTAWEENRKKFNAFCRKRNLPQWVRPPEVFWSGEQFVMSADVFSEEEPGAVRVFIEGTDYRTRLYRKDGRWMGTLFDGSMIRRWGQNGKQPLNFIFSAVVGGSYCEDRKVIYVDDRQPYWLMHRKE